MFAAIEIGQVREQHLAAHARQANLRRHLLRGLPRAPTVNDYVGACRRQLQCDGLADAAGRTRNEGAETGQLAARSLL